MMSTCIIGKCVCLVGLACAGETVSPVNCNTRNKIYVRCNGSRSDYCDAMLRMNLVPATDDSPMILFPFFRVLLDIAVVVADLYSRFSIWMKFPARWPCDVIFFWLSSLYSSIENIWYLIDDKKYARQFVFVDARRRCSRLRQPCR